MKLLHCSPILANVYYACNDFFTDCPSALELSHGARVPVKNGAVFILPTILNSKVPYLLIYKQTDDTVSPQWMNFGTLYQHFLELSRRLKW